MRDKLVFTWTDFARRGTELQRTHLLAALLRQVIAACPAVLLLSAAVVGWCDSAPLSRLEGTPPCAELVAVARSNNIPLEQIDPLSTSRALTPGDSITALVTLDDKGKRRLQWLLYLKVAGEPRATNPLSGGASSVEPRATNSTRIVMHSSTGTELEFLSTPVPVTLRTIGPFDVSGRKRGPKQQDKAAQFTLNEGFLALGLDRAAVALMRLRQSGVKGSFAFSNRRFSEDTIAKTLEKTAPVKLTTNEQRALAGAGPALTSYFDIVRGTEGLSDILFELIDMPSMWSLLRKGGVHTNFRFANENLGTNNSASVKLGAPSYNLPLVLELNKHRALDLTFVATSADPPLLPCAGVVALLAEKPGDKRTYMTVRLLSARRGDSTTRK